MSVIDDIKSRLDLVELISETVKLRKSGRTLTGLCPFHPHKNNTPSFAVWPDSGNWRCFGQCNEGGDAFKFVMKRDGVDFAEALRILAQRTGVVLTPRSPEQQERDDNLDHLRRLLDDAAVYYHHLLKNSAGAQHARAHVAGRGLTDKAVEMFQLGYAPDQWDAALKYFTSKGYAQQDLLDAGLIVVKDETENVKVFDRFRDRLMIPVRDERGRMTGFQARALQPDAIPKFMNSPQTALFDKGRTLFGLDLARKAIREAQAAIVVEGNLDVVAAHQAGFANVVSSQGTALTEHQMRLLKKHAPRIILALDADAAGDAATLRGLNVAREALDRESEIGFDPRGLVKTEGRLGADLRVMTLPPGLDPDEVINANPEQWRQIVADAEPVVAYVIRVLTTGRDLDDPKVKTEIAATVLPLIEDVAQPIERDTYRQKLARVLRVDERSLVVRATGPARRPYARSSASAGASADAASADAAADQTTPATSAPPASAQVVSKLEAYCLGALLGQPDLLYKADRELQQLGLPKLAAGDFVAVEHQLIFSALSASLEQVDLDPAEYIRSHLDPTLQPRMERLRIVEAPPETFNNMYRKAAPTDVRINEELFTVVMRLRKRTIDAWLSELHFLAEDAGEQGDPRAEAYQQEINRQTTASMQIDLALARRGKRGERPPKVG